MTYRDPYSDRVTNPDPSMPDGAEAALWGL